MDATKKKGKGKVKTRRSDKTRKSTSQWLGKKAGEREKKEGDRTKKGSPYFEKGERLREQNPRGRESHVEGEKEETSS